MECGVYGDLIIVYPKPYCVYLRRTIRLGAQIFRGLVLIIGTPKKVHLILGNPYMGITQAKMETTILL